MKWLMLGMSKFPFPVLHVLSDGLCFLLYRVFRYRRKVVRENLNSAFPEKSHSEILEIEKKFYRNFSDILMETIKNFSITEKELRDRCHFMTPAVSKELWDRQVNVAGISSHLGNWEILALSLSLEFKHQCLGVYKPLSNPKMNKAVVESRERFGIKMVPIKKVREVIDQKWDRPYVLGLLSDQAPHDYSKAFEVQFLNRKTFVVPGPGIITLERGLTPIWGWMRRVGRSRFEWGVEVLDVDPSRFQWTEEDRAQIERIAKANGISLERSEQALALIKIYSEKLEAQIRMAPQDWLWSHRRWKSR
jgi:KDO2-lipid IV(A) lauroyltransferase